MNLNTKLLTVDYDWPGPKKLRTGDVDTLANKMYIQYPYIIQPNITIQILQIIQLESSSCVTLNIIPLQEWT